MTKEERAAFKELVDAVGETLDKDFGFWSSPSNAERRTRIYRAWHTAHAIEGSIND